MTWHVEQAIEPSQAPEALQRDQLGPPFREGSESWRTFEVDIILVCQREQVVPFVAFYRADVVALRVAERHLDTAGAAGRMSRRSSRSPPLELTPCRAVAE